MGASRPEAVSHAPVGSLPPDLRRPATRGLTHTCSTPGRAVRAQVPDRPIAPSDRALRLDAVCGRTRWNGFWAGSGDVRAAAVISAIALVVVSALPAGAAAWTVVADAGAPAATEPLTLPASRARVVRGRLPAERGRGPGADRNGVGKSWKRMSRPVPAGSGRTSRRFRASCARARQLLRRRHLPRVAAPLLIHRWNGKAWGLMNGTSVQPAQRTSLNSVACPSPKSCFAVGYYQDLKGAIKTLVERWTGAAWNAMAAPTASGARPSCTTSRASRTRAASRSAHRRARRARSRSSIRWNGKTWAGVATPGLATAGLDVVCASAKAASRSVGEEDHEHPARTVERHEVVGRHVEEHAGANHLFGIACPTTTACIGRSQGVDDRRLPDAGIEVERHHVDRAHPGQPADAIVELVELGDVLEREPVPGRRHLPRRRDLPLADRVLLVAAPLQPREAPPVGWGLALRVSALGCPLLDDELRLLLQRDRRLGEVRGRAAAVLRREHDRCGNALALEDRAARDLAGDLHGRGTRRRDRELRRRRRLLVVPLDRARRGRRRLRVQQRGAVARSLGLRHEGERAARDALRALAATDLAGRLHRRLDSWCSRASVRAATTLRSR